MKNGFEPTHDNETDLATIETVGHTEIRDFEASHLVTTEQVADFLSETLPSTHLENCPSIEYETDPNPLYPDALGLFDSLTHEIHIHGPAERFENAGILLEVITHEVGHNIHHNLIADHPEVAERWAELHTQSWEQYFQDRTGFVSDYARTNVYEDFAETYQFYVRDSELLQLVIPEKYEFMQQEVFSGREYPHMHAYWDYDSAGNKEVCG